MPRREQPAAIYVPTSVALQRSILIDSADVTRDVMSAEFTSSIIGLESPCKIRLIDPKGTYASQYIGGEVIQYKLGRGESPVVWEGKLERPKQQFGANYELEVIGSHYQ